MTHDLSENDLLEQIGMELAERDFLMEPQSREELIEKGKKWLKENYFKLEEAICLNDKIQSFYNNSETNTDTILTAIADLISSICIGVSPFTVSQLLIKRGLNEFCGGHWEQ